MMRFAVATTLLCLTAPAFAQAPPVVDQAPEIVVLLQLRSEALQREATQLLGRIQAERRASACEEAKPPADKP